MLIKRFITALLCAALLVQSSFVPATADIVINSFAFETAVATGGADATQFNGSTQYLNHTNGTGFSDSGTFTFNFWVKRATDSTTERIFFVNATGGAGADGRFLPGFDTSDQFILFARNSSGTELLNITCTTTPISDTNWHHILASIDLSVDDSSHRYVYIDDVAQSMTVTTFVNSSIDFSGNAFTVAANSVSFTAKFFGALSELYLDTGTFINLSVEANRRKFITSGGLPADLGSDGSTPSGSSPEVYLADGLTQTGTTTAFTATGSPTAVDGPNP